MTVEPTDLWVIACAAWNNVTPQQMADMCNKSGDRMPEGSRKAWGRVFEAIQGPAWQPIETAPKDGTWVFLFVPGHGPARARWNSQHRGWLSHINGKEITLGTHWQSLPTPPEGET